MLSRATGRAALCTTRTLHAAHRADYASGSSTVARGVEGDPGTEGKRAPVSARPGSTGKKTPGHQQQPMRTLRITPATDWNSRARSEASRKPLLAMARAKAAADAATADLKTPVMKKRDARRAMTLYFRRGAPPVLGGAETPTLQYAPPFAVPAGTKVDGNDTTGSMRERLQQVRSMLAAQVGGGDYTAYLPGQTLRADARQPDGRLGTPEDHVLDAADQAMSGNTSLHPAARRFITQRIAAHLGVPS
ncbi:hypothetical protein MSPP1_002215 [Malassezia sp. CBS 17886]|nr:hypothetical protein MSPP1_002215 [Malassezia sp. CBS 17886]